MAIAQQSSVSVRQGSGRRALRPVRQAQRFGDGGARDAVLERALRMVDPEVAESFTPEQRRAIRTMLDLRRATQSLVDVRQGFTLGGRRYFLSLLFGRERRRFERRRPGGLHGWLRDHGLTLIASALALALVFLVAAALRG